MSVGPVLVGGLGAPYDALLAAVARARGLDARPLGALDREAHERGRRALARNPCAPLLYTTGALLRAASDLPAGAGVSVVGVRSCGPCRFALFGPTWQRALDREGGPMLDVIAIDQEPDAVAAWIGEAGLAAMLEAIAAGDALGEVVRRLRPYLAEPDALDDVVAGALATTVAAIERGASPIAALAEQRGFHVGLARRAPAPLARIALVGEPFSLHADGAPQLHLPRVLARAGVEVEAPPLSLWIALRAWEMRAPAWGRARATRPSASRALEAATRDALAGASAALGLGGLELPDLDALAELAAPHVPAEVRGGYGHLEVALALRAQRERRAHAVISVKSFGCIPSSGLADAIVPVALGDLPFLALEVSSDGAAARESRLMLRVAGAHEAAARELARACAGREHAALPDVDPLRGEHETGARPYACTLACEVGRRTGGAS